MRSVLASVLMLVLSLPLVAPAFFSVSAEESLPACCRRLGAHHCTMSAVSVAVSTHSRAVAPRCPWSPSGRVALMLPHAFAPQSALQVAYSAHAATMIREAEAGYRISSHRTRQKRGPPTLLAL